MIGAAFSSSLLGTYQPCRRRVLLLSPLADSSSSPYIGRKELMEKKTTSRPRAEDSRLYKTMKTIDNGVLRGGETS